MRCFQKHLLQQLRVIEAFRIPLQECDCGERALLCMQLARFLKFQQRRNKKCSGWIDNHDALALLQHTREMNSFDGCADYDGNSHEKPKACESIPVDKNANWIDIAAAHILRAVRRWFRVSEIGRNCFHG